MHKKLIVPMLIISGFALGYGAVQARWHPVAGIDYPLDPPNYYSLTSISYPDSAPSIFTLRDIAGQGGSVYDYERHLKSIDAVQNLTDWLTQALEALGIRIANTTPMSGDILYPSTEDIAKLNKNTRQKWMGTDAASFLQGTLLRSYDRYDEDTNTYDKQAQYQKAEEMYKSYAASAKAVLDAQDKEQEILDRIMTASASAAGEMQMEQMKVQAEAIQSAENARRDMLLGNIASLKAVEDAVQADEDIASYRQIQAAQIQIQDPYDRTELEQKQYERPTGKGFVEFKQ